jgi:hypothetical protein
MFSVREFQIDQAIKLLQQGRKVVCSYNISRPMVMNENGDIIWEHDKTIVRLSKALLNTLFQLA